MSVKDHVREALANASANDYHFDHWTPEATAVDMVMYCSDLEDCCIDDVAQAIREIRSEA